MMFFFNSCALEARSSFFSDFFKWTADFFVRNNNLGGWFFSLQVDALGDSRKSLNVLFQEK
jgi:hypothetical protein